jgi:hypothetical protein
MFNRQIEMRLVKKSKKNADEASTPEVSAEDINNILEDVITGTGRVIVQVAASLMLVDTVRKIVINRLSK